MEGGPLSTEGDDARDGRIEISENSTSGNAQGCKRSTVDTPVASLILDRLIAAIVNLAIDLDCDAVAKATKVELIAELRVLTAKLEAVRALAQLFP